MPTSILNSRIYGQDTQVIQNYSKLNNKFIDNISTIKKKHHKIMQEYLNLYYI